MTYFNFTKITPPAPNDPTVNETTQINANWDHLDLKLQPYATGAALTGLETGQEYIDSNGRFAVWDGAAARIPADIDAGWSSWTALPVVAPRVARTNFTPRWRSNSAYRMVELSGGVLFDSSASAWPMGNSFNVNVMAPGSPPISLAPIGGVHKAPCATALTSGAPIVAAGLAIITTDISFVQIAVQYMGGPGGGNFVQLDQVWWWY